MRLPTKTLAAALVAASVPLYAGPAAAAPLSQSLALNNADIGTVEQVQYRRWNRGWRGGVWRGGRWIGPAAGVAAGLAIAGGAIAASQYYNDGYYAYGAAPGAYYAYGAAPGYYGRSFIRDTPQYGSCTGDRYSDSSYPSWACR